MVQALQEAQKIADKQQSSVFLVQIVDRPERPWEIWASPPNHQPYKEIKPANK